MIEGLEHETLTPWSHTMTIWDYFELYTPWRDEDGNWIGDRSRTKRTGGAYTIGLRRTREPRLWSAERAYRTALRSRVTLRAGQETEKVWTPRSVPAACTFRLTPEQRAAIARDPRRPSAIAKAFGITPSTVTRIKRAAHDRRNHADTGAAGAAPELAGDAP